MTRVLRGVLSTLLLVVPGLAVAQPSALHGPSPQLQAGGLHYRLVGARGVVHVFQPPGYDVRRAGVVVYQHGYTNSSDRALRLHYLLPQFAASGRNALFIVPDGPRRPHERVRWPSLQALLDAVAVAIDGPLPKGARVLVAHSGGYRSVARWATPAGASDVLLLDASYGNYKAFQQWLAARGDRRLGIVSYLTRSVTEPWLRKLPEVRRRRRIPSSFAALSAAEREARVLYFRSQWGHSAMLRARVVLPLLLQRTRLGACGTILAWSVAR